MSREPEHLVDWWVSHEALRNEARRELGSGAPRPPTAAALEALEAATQIDPHKTQIDQKAQIEPYGGGGGGGGGGGVGGAFGRRFGGGGAVGGGGIGAEREEEGGAPVVCALPPAHRTLLIEKKELRSFSWEQVPSIERERERDREIDI